MRDKKRWESPSGPLQHQARPYETTPLYEASEPHQAINRLVASPDAALCACLSIACPQTRGLLRFFLPLPDRQSSICMQPFTLGRLQCFDPINWRSSTHCSGCATSWQQKLDSFRLADLSICYGFCRSDQQSGDNQN